MFYCYHEYWYRYLLFKATSFCTESARNAQKYSAISYTVECRLSGHFSPASFPWILISCRHETQNPYWTFEPEKHLPGPFTTFHAWIASYSSVVAIRTRHHYNHNFHYPGSRLPGLFLGFPTSPDNRRLTVVGYSTMHLMTELERYVKKCMQQRKLLIFTKVCFFVVILTKTAKIANKNTAHIENL